MGNELGQVGWADGSTVDLGDSTNDGNTLVHVTLFAGRDASVSLDQSQAQGQEILCTLATHVQLPPKGARVMVAIPEHFGTVPGAAMIIGIASNNWRALGNAQPGEQVWQVPGCPIQMFFRKSGVWGVKTTDSGGNDTVLTVEPGKIEFTSPTVKMVGDALGWRHYHLDSGAFYELIATSPLPAPLGAISSFFKAHAGICKLDGKVFLGADAPGTSYQPVPTGLVADPGGTPLYSALLTALTNYNTALAACVSSLVSASGVTPAQQTAFATAVGALTAAISADSLVVTSSSVSASIP